MHKFEKEIKKCEYKINYYKIMNIILPTIFTNDQCALKIRKYTNRMANIIGESKLLHKDLAIFSKNLHKQNSNNLTLLNNKKKKILVVGTLENQTEIFLYTNIILKNIDYTQTVVNFYDTSTNCMIEYNNSSFLQNKSYRNVLYYMNLEEIDASLYDIGIYISNVKNTLSIPMQMSKISYLYLCGDININNLLKYNNLINRTFDAILYPDKKNLEIFKSIYLPKINLPLSLDLEYYKNLNFTTTNIIGYFGTVSEAQCLISNLLKIENILKKHNIKVHIYYLLKNIDLNIDYDGNEKSLVKKLKSLATPNINVFKADTLQYFCEVKKYAKDCDAFIFSTQFEDFIYNPRQILSCGKTIFVPTNYNIETDANIGIYKYSDDLTTKISDYVSNKDKIDSLFEKRKSIAEKYSKKINSIYYKALSNFELINISDKNEFSNQKFYLKDKNLYVKYKKYIGKYEYNISNNLTIIPANDAGFFSVYNKHVSFLAYKDEEEIIIPDWRFSKFHQNLYKYWKAEQPGSWCYGKYSDGNIYLKLFETPYTKDIIDLDIYESDIMYDYANKVIDLPEYNFDNEPFLTYIYSYELPKDMEYYTEFRNKYHNIVSKYMKPLPYIQKQIEQFKTKYIDNHFCISIHIRCSAHAAELLESTEFEKYESHIKNILSKNNIDILNPDWRLFIATDNEVALNHFKNLYPNNIIYQNNITRLTNEQEIEYQTIKSKKNKDLGGYELQQRNAISDDTRNIKLAIDVLTDAYLLSSCDYFIYQNSNVSTAVSYLNPNIKMVYCT